MQEFKNYLQQELLRRTTKNSSYSLRSFALQLGVNHATLSSLISGKRKMTPSTVEKLAKALNLGPEELSRYRGTANSGSTNSNYFVIQQDAFSAMSEWYFDAILELSLIPYFKLEPEIIAKSIGISELQARLSLETLERLELLYKDDTGQLKLKHQNSINILDSDFTSAANRKHQKSILEKSAEAIESVDRKLRDHTSTTMAINVKDLPKAKELIQKFRHEINAFLQRGDATPEEVYQLQVSFFPLSKNLKNQEQE
jgi:uncharacterized protein (TIGR02147 family)